MIFKPKFRKYVKFNISAATLYQAEDQDGKGIPWGYIADDYTITGYNGNLNANDYNNAIQDRSQSLKGDAYITNLTAFVDSDVPNRISIAIYDADGVLQVHWHHDFTPAGTFNENYLSIDFDKGNYHLFKKGCRFNMQVVSLDKQTPLNPTSHWSFEVAGIMDNTETSGDANYLDNWSTLPDWSIFDFLTSLAFTDHKAFFINSPTDQNLLQAVSLKEIAANSAKNWSSKIDIDSVKHIYRDDNLAQTNVIQYTKDETLSGEINNIFSYYDTKDSTLDAKKEFFTSKFRHSPDDGFFPPIQNSGTHIPLAFYCDKEPVPGLVTTSEYGSVWKDETQQYWSAAETTYLTDKDDDYLTYTLMNPHKIEAKFHLNVLDLYQIDFTHPIFLAQFGQIYYIEEIKFNAE